MRLINAHITGIGRLADAKINLDRKVVAIVGPNEAGKTTLLTALERITSGTPVPNAQRSRHKEIGDNDVVVRVSFQLDQEDIQAISEIPHEGSPATVEFTRRASGYGPMVTMLPKPTKRFTVMDSILKRLSDANDSLAEEVIPPGGEMSEEDEEWETLVNTVYSFVTELGRLLNNKEESNDELLKEITETSESLAAEGSDLEIMPILNEATEWLSSESPSVAIRNLLWNRSPEFAFFDDDSRNLSSSYDLDEEVVKNPPDSLRNLARIAGLDLPLLLQNYNEDQSTARQIQLRQANNRLAEEFVPAWNQSEIKVEFDMEEAVLYIYVVEGKEVITIFDERSTGLRLYIALWAFVRSRNVSTKPILLIDEAELHLHLDAQADLVQTLLTQEEAANVIYTTHSPGCLPPDLGTGVRVVTPSKENPNLSTIHNGFWTNSVGFSPLMMAMGAGAAAFSVAKCVVLAEGPSEMLMLPSLIRHATDSSSLPYQVAPGLSEAPKRIYPDLDLEAARVVYLVDGDGGGLALKKGLIDADVPEHLIIELGAITLENLLNPAVYQEVARDLLQECNPGFTIGTLPDFENDPEPWGTTLEKWAEVNGLNAPSKIAMSSRIVERNQAIASDHGAEVLRKLHTELMAALRLPVA